MNYLLTILLFCSPLVGLIETHEMECTTASSQLDEQRCQEIFDQLKKAKGLLASQKPKLIIKRNLSNPKFAMAMMDHREGIIEVEKRLILMCQQKLGNQAEEGLAFILAHELAHYFNKHEVVHPALKDISSHHVEADSINRLIDRVNSITDSDAQQFKAYLKEMAAMFRIRENESRADLEAGLLCYLAGFGELDAGVQFLDAAYEFYRLDTTAGKYPSLSQRKSIVKQAELQLDTMIQLHRAGALFQIFGRNGWAEKCYLTVLNDFQNTEIFNNLGALEIRKSLNNYERMLSSAREMLLPISVFIPPIGGGGEDFTQMSREEWQKLVKESRSVNLKAESYLDQSIKINPDQYVAYLNKSINHVVQYELLNGVLGYDPTRTDQTPDPVHQLHHAKSNALTALEHVQLFFPDNMKALSDIYGMMGIIENLLNNPTLALEYCTQSLAYNADNYFVLKNIDIIKGETNLHVVKEEQSSFRSLCDQDELINNRMSVADILHAEETKWSSRILLSEYADYSGFSEKTYLRSGKYKDLEVITTEYFTYDKLSKVSTVVWSDTNYSGMSSCGAVKVGDTLEKVILNYGPVYSSTHSPEYFYVEYSGSTDWSPSTCQCHIVFGIDSDEKITHIGWYSEFKPERN